MRSVSRAGPSAIVGRAHCRFRLGGKKGDSDGIFVQVEIGVGMCTQRYTFLIDNEARGVQS